MDNKKLANNSTEQVKQLFESPIPGRETTTSSEVSLTQNLAANLNLNQILLDGNIDKFQDYLRKYLASQDVNEAHSNAILWKLIEKNVDHRDHQKCAVHLIQKTPINPNYHPEDNGVTILMKAAEQQMVEIVKLLLQNEQTQVNKIDSRGETALIYSIKHQKTSTHDHLQIIQLLLENGANPNIKYIEEVKGEMGQKEQPLLHVCVLNQWEEIVKLLLQYNVDVNATDKQGDTAVHIVARKKQRKEILEYLLKTNPNLKIQNLNHQTALDVAQEDKKKLLQAKIQEYEEEQLKQQEILAAEQKTQNNSNNIDSNQQIHQDKTNIMYNQNQDQIQQQEVISGPSSPQTKEHENENIQEDQQDKDQQQDQLVQGLDQNKNEKSEEDPKQQREQQGKEQKEQRQNSNSSDQGTAYQNNQKYNMQSKKQLSQNSTIFQMNTQVGHPTNTANTTNNLNQQNNFSSPQQSQYNTQNVKPNSNINNNPTATTTTTTTSTTITNQNNPIKGQQQQQQFYPNQQQQQQQQQYQNYQTQQQHTDRNKNAPIQQIQQTQQPLNGANRGNAANFNYQQKSPINQVGTPNQNILQQPPINGTHQQQIYPSTIQKAQIQTPIPSNSHQNATLQQASSPPNTTEEYPLWPESIKIFEFMKTSIVTKNNPNRISIDISDDQKRFDLNQNATMIAYISNIDKVIKQITIEKNHYKQKYEQKEQECQILIQKNQELQRQINYQYQDMEQQIQSEQIQNEISQNNNDKDPMHCTSRILDWDWNKDLIIRKQGDPSINYFKNTQMLSKKEIIPCLIKEIKDFEREVNEYNKQMESTFDELIRKVEDIIKQQFPNIKLQKYGSYATKLCLPWSDIDIVVDTSNLTEVPNTHQSFLRIIEQLLIAHKDLIHETLNVTNTTVPVLKVTCSQKYDYKKLDITILEGKHTGLKCVDLVNNYINAYQFLKPLVLVLKQFLHALEMNDTYKGGLSSYSLILMLVYFIQQKQITEDLPDNEGELLIQFLVFYGFDEQKAKLITPKKVDAKGEIDQSSPQHNMNNYPFSNFTVGTDQKIHIMDPQNFSNNVSRSTFHYNKIKTAMACSYTIIHTMFTCQACRNQREQREQQKRPCLILKRLFYLPGKIMDIQDCWVIHPVQQQQFPFYNQYGY